MSNELKLALDSRQDPSAKALGYWQMSASGRNNGRMHHRCFFDLVTIHHSRFTRFQIKLPISCKKSLGRKA